MGKENKKPSGFTAYMAKMKAQNEALNEHLGEQQRLTETVKEALRQANATISIQAHRIREQQRELEIMQQTLELRHQEIDALYNRNWWERLMNLAPNE